MYLITKKQKLAENTYLMQIEAPSIAKKAQPGQFVILKIDEKGERIPLTIADYDKKTITVIVLVVGRTTKLLSHLKKGDYLMDLLGPLGNKSEIKEYGTVCLVGGGVGIAPIYPIAKALKKAKNNIITIIGAKNKNLLFWEDRFNEISDKLIVCTDDGSKGRKGFVSDALKELINKEKPNRVIAVGPVIMMKVISDLTRSIVKTFVSLNPIMIDGIGMCGCCRVVVDDMIKFTCCDGPEFDGHMVDWDELINRNKTYTEEEKIAKKTL